jgi:hypothetical protein
MDVTRGSHLELQRKDVPLDAKAIVKEEIRVLAGKIKFIWANLAADNLHACCCRHAPSIIASLQQELDPEAKPYPEQNWSGLTGNQPLRIAINPRYLLAALHFTHMDITPPIIKKNIALLLAITITHELARAWYAHCHLVFRCVNSAYAGRIEGLN